MMDFVEFFAGVGLVREGLSGDGWRCVFANDISNDKRDTYVTNFDDQHFHLGDIWGLLEMPHTVPNNAFLYTGSFPCTDLSVAGGRAGLAGVQSGSINALLKLIEFKSQINGFPKVVLLENVQGFLTSNNGEDVAGIIRILSEFGYFIDLLEVDAVDFTPQSRPRVFLIAVLKSAIPSFGKIKPMDSLFSSWWSYFDKEPRLRSHRIKRIVQANEDLNWVLFDIPAPASTSKKLKSIIEVDLPDDSKLWWNPERQKHLFNQMSERHKLVLLKMQAQNEYSYGTVYRRVRKGRSMAELRTDGIAGCLRTPKGGSSKQILIRAGFGKWAVRLLTPREYARLQGVRDDFILPQNANKGYFAMGDAVCVPVISYLSKNILLPIYQQQIKRSKG